MVLPYINMNPPQVYMCSPSWTFLLPRTIPSGSSQCTTPKHPVSCIEPELATRFIYDIVHVSMPFSQIIPPSPSPTESVPFAILYTGLLLPSFYIPYICVSILYLCFSFWLTSLCIIGSGFIRRVSTRKLPSLKVIKISMCVLSHFSHVRRCATLWTVTCQTPLSMGFFRQEYWSGLPCPPPGTLTDLAIEPSSLMSPEGEFFTTNATWEVQKSVCAVLCLVTLVVSDSLRPHQATL